MMYTRRDPQDILNHASNNSVIDFGHTFVSKPLVLSNKSGITIKGTIVGGVPTHEWQPLDASDPLYSRIPESVRAHVWTTTASIPGDTPFKSISAQQWGNSTNTRTSNVWPTLIWNNKAMILARSPGYESSGSTGTSTTLNYTGTRPESYASIVGLCVVGFFSYGWAPELRTVSGINPSTNVLTCSSTTYNVHLSNPRFFYANVPEELDEEGEYYIDRNGLGQYGRIYFIAPGLVDPNTAPSYVSTSHGWPTSGALLTLSSCTDLDFQCNIIGGVNKGLKVVSGNEMNFHDFVVAGMGRAALDIDGNNLIFDNMTVETCMDMDMYIQAGNLKTLTSGNVQINNCSFLNSTILGLYGSGACLLSGCGYDVTNCLFKDAFGQSLRFAGSSINVNDCEFNNVVSHMQDCAAVYWGRNPIWSDINLNNCVFNNINNGINPGVDNTNTGEFTACVYMDDGAGNGNVNNCTFNSSDRGIHTNGGRNIHVLNPTFNDCFIAWKYDGALTTWGYERATLVNKSVSSTAFTCNQSGFVAGVSTTMSITGLTEALTVNSDVYFPSENILLTLSASASIGATTLSFYTSTPTTGSISNGSTGYTGGEWQYTTQLHSSSIDSAIHIASEPALAVYFSGANDEYRLPDGSSITNADYNNCDNQVVRTNFGAATFTEN